MPFLVCVLSYTLSLPCHPFTLLLSFMFLVQDVRSQLLLQPPCLLLSVTPPFDRPGLLSLCNQIVTQERHQYPILDTFSGPGDKGFTVLAQSGFPRASMNPTGQSPCCLGPLCDVSSVHSTSHISQGFVPWEDAASVYYQKGKLVEIF